MSERIYLLLLRLYPGQFRQSYGEEALQLFGDRLRDETGFLRRSRLWLELVIDLGALHVRGYHEAVVVRAAAAERGSGVPSFASVEEDALEFRFLLWGGVLSLIFCGSTLLALQYGGVGFPIRMQCSDRMQWCSRRRRSRRLCSAMSRRMLQQGKRCSCMLW